MSNFPNLLVLAISTDENNPMNFSKPTPEASPVLTLGKDSKGQVRTSLSLAGVIAVNEIPYMVQSSSTLSSNIPGQPRNTTTIGHRREGSVLVHHMGFGIQNGFYTLHAFLAAWLFSFL